VRRAVDQSSVHAAHRSGAAAATPAIGAAATAVAASATAVASCAAAPSTAGRPVGVLLLGEPVLREAAHLAGADAQLPVGVEHRRIPDRVRAPGRPAE